MLYVYHFDGEGEEITRPKDRKRRGAAVNGLTGRGFTIIKRELYHKYLR